MIDPKTFAIMRVYAQHRKDKANGNQRCLADGNLVKQWINLTDNFNISYKWKTSDKERGKWVSIAERRFMNTKRSKKYIRRLCNYNKLSEAYIEKNFNVLFGKNGGGKLITRTQTLSCAFILKHQHRLGWKQLFRFQTLSKACLEMLLFSHYWGERRVCNCDIYWEDIVTFQKHAVTDDLMEKYSHLFNIHQRNELERLRLKQEKLKRLQTVPRFALALSFTLDYYAGVMPAIFAEL